MIDCKWKYIVQRFHGSIINAFACLLESHELKDTVTLIGYFFPSFVTASISGSAKFVSMDRGASVISGCNETAAWLCSELQTASCKSAWSMLLLKVSGQVISILVPPFHNRSLPYKLRRKKRERFSCLKNRVGKRLTAVCIEYSRK